jgi:hypothetical protein
MFFSAPPHDFTEFDAEIELALEDKITYPSYFFIPKGSLL